MEFLVTLFLSDIKWLHDLQANSKRSWIQTKLFNFTLPLVLPGDV